MSLNATRSMITFLALAYLLPGLAEAAREKIDVVSMKNGDRLTGEIKDLDRGRLQLSTDYMGTVDIEWVQVAKVTSPQYFELEDEIGKTYFGPLSDSPEMETVSIDDVTTTNVTVENDSVIYLTPIGKGFWTRLTAGVDLGMNFTRANRAITWNLDAAVQYLGRHFETRADFSSLLTGQDPGTTSTRNVLNLRYDRYLKNRWFLTGVGRGEQNDELRLDYRTLVGAGIGKNVVQNNRMRLDLLGGFAYSRERFITEEPLTTLKPWPASTSIFSPSGSRIRHCGKSGLLSKFDYRGPIPNSFGYEF